MIKRIDLFMPPISHYGDLNFMTKDLFQALKRKGVNTRLLVAQKDNPIPFLESVFIDPPECSLSFNGLLPDEKGIFFCDLIKIPHVAFLVDSPNPYVALTRSPLSIISCPDLFSCTFFEGLNFKNVFFLPPGVNKEITPDPKLKRKFDVVLFASCIDYESLRNSWKEKYSKPLCDALDDAAERTLSDKITPYMEAFAEALNVQMGKTNSIDPQKINLLEILNDLEDYIRGKDRVQLVQSIKDAKVDIFGADSSTWEKYLGKKYPNIICHDPVPYEESLEIMKQSKIMLNSCPQIKNGGPESLFAGMACEALVITNENIFARKHFEEGKDLSYYQHNQLNKVNALVNSYLADEAKREMVAKNGRKKVMAAHTWDHRVDTLLEALPPILKKIRERLK